MVKKFSSSNLRRIASEKNISQMAIADKLGTYSANVSGWFTGKNVPGGNTVAELAFLLGVPIDDLYEDDESEQISLAS